MKSNEIIRFGKYKGQTYEYVFQNDPQYLLWCILNIDDFYLPWKYTVKMIEDKIRELELEQYKDPIELFNGFII